MLTAESSAKMQTNSTRDLISGKPVLLVLVALIFFVLGTFFGNSLESGWKNQKTGANVQGRFGAVKPTDSPSPSPRP